MARSIGGKIIGGKVSVIKVKSLTQPGRGEGGYRKVSYVSIFE